MRSKKTVDEIVTAAARQVAQQNGWAVDDKLPLFTDYPPENKFGDLCTPFALSAAKAARRPPMEIAGAVLESLQGRPHDEKFFESATVDAPGYINFALSRDWLEAPVRSALERPREFGQSDSMHGERIRIETMRSGKSPGDEPELRDLRITIVSEVLAELLKAQGASVELSGPGERIEPADFRSYSRILKVVACGDYGDLAARVPEWKEAGYPVDRLRFVLCQSTRIRKDGADVSLSVRSDAHISFSDLLRDIDREVIRYFFIMKGLNSEMAFDWNLARTASMDNPAYHVYYVYERLHALLRKADDAGMTADPEHLPMLTLPEERVLMKSLFFYSSTLSLAAALAEPHRVTSFLDALAKSFHSYYTYYRVVDPGKKELTQARLCLMEAVRVSMAHAFGLLGIPASSGL